MKLGSTYKWSLIKYFGDKGLIALDIKGGMKVAAGGNNRLLQLHPTKLTSTSNSHVGFESSHDTTLIPYKFSIYNSNKAYFGALESPFNC